jgi:hypothetical protein
MRKSNKSTYNPIGKDRLAVLSLNYNIRYDGQYDDGRGKLLLAILPHTVPAGTETRTAERPGKTVTET